MFTCKQAKDNIQSLKLATDPSSSSNQCLI